MKATEVKQHRGVELTRHIARAAATDAGNRNMRKHGRKAWNVDDWNVAAECMAQLLKGTGVES